MVINSSTLKHAHFYELPKFLTNSDLLVLNNTKVIPVRIDVQISKSSSLDVLAVGPTEQDPLLWKALYKGKFSGLGRWADVDVQLSISSDRSKFIRFFIDDAGKLQELFWRHGNMPLPPYIKRQPTELDKIRYQTVYASCSGSIAAPTAGMHFTGPLLETLASKGINIQYLTLHVGVGTFKPIKSQYLHEHRMDSEHFYFDERLLELIRVTKAQGGRVVAVGTTTTRTLEGYFSGKAQVTVKDGIISGQTDIFIYPGYEFKVVDAIITNFHLPQSTPLMLVSAFATWQTIYNAYQEAISRRYRFFSYGDAMLVFKKA